MNRLSHRDLMRCYDRDLSAAEEESLQERLAEDPESRQVLRELELVGEAVRDWAEANSGAAEGIADRVMTRISSEENARPSRFHRGRVAAVAGALAIAASVAIALIGPWRVPGRTGQMLADPDQGSSAAIEIVDFGSQNGTIFLVQADDEATTPVVWLADEAEPEECDTETL